MRNVEVGDLLERISYLLDAAGENRFKAIAFRRASNSVRNLDDDVEQVWREKRLLEVPGIGEGIAKKIEEYFETGGIKYLQDLEKRVPPGATELMKIPGVGPKTAFKLAQDHKIRSVDQLKQELKAGKLTAALGPVVSKKILEEIDKMQAEPRRMLLIEAMVLAQEIKDYFSAKGITVEFAGSLRRGKSTVADLDVLSLDEASSEASVEYPGMDRIIERGSTRVSVVLRNGVQVDLRVMKKEEYGAGLIYFTGSKEHGVELRRIAIEKGWKLNEYGIFEGDGKTRVAGETETEVYAKLGLAYIEPEMRENRGEIEAAMKDGRLPRLIQLDAIRGDMHTHSSWSDGREELEVMAMAAKSRGYEYMTISDHSVGVGIANGLTEERFRKQWKVIERLNDELSPFRILRGVEAEVKGDGSLDFERKFFEEFDFVGASIHQGYRQSPEKLTERAVKVLSNPVVDLFCHPTNRLIGRREGHPLDLTRVIRTARENGKMLEIDGQPNRMDLDDIWSRRAMEEGVPLVVDSDAHSTGEFENVRFGVIVARRAWLEAKHVFNALPLRDALRRLGKH